LPSRRIASSTQAKPLSASSRVNCPDASGQRASDQLVAAAFAVRRTPAQGKVEHGSERVQIGGRSQSLLLDQNLLRRHEGRRA
jgi:hypothetical protein